MHTKPKDSDENYDLSKKNADEMFCYSCGRVVKVNALICPKCGVSLKYAQSVIGGKKEKETAILLSIFTSFFVWAYLYDKSELKFWIGFVVSVLSAIMAKITFDDKVNYWYLFLVPAIIIWIFSVIDVAGKSKEYFESLGGR